MLIDARSLPQDSQLRADVCIVGSGAAGLTVANELARSARVIVIESGGTAFQARSQRLHEGVVSGHAYYPLDACRFRVLGGTTSVWGGWCRPLDEIDFEASGDVPQSGWPITRNDLDSFYERAQKICGLGPYDYDAATWRRTIGASPLTAAAAFDEALFQIRATRFGEMYEPLARRSRNFDVVLNATAVDLQAGNAHTIAALQAATFRRTRLTIRADTFVLAAGGIENARLLLASAGAQGRGAGNGHDLVGRYFTDHLHVPLGVLTVEPGAADFFRATLHDGVSVRGALASPKPWRTSNGGFGFGITLHDADDPHDVLSIAQTSRSYTSLVQLLRGLRRGQLSSATLQQVRDVVTRPREVCRLAYRRIVRSQPRRFFIGCRAEQAPNRANRVMLDRTTDAFGVRRAAVDWRVSPQDLATLTRAHQHVAEAFRGHRVEMFPEEIVHSTIAAGAHHIGTTRMHRDPRLGVVNEDCRVHGTSNLYVAGSSVFPTAGWAPPTLTIVALALRLADRLAGNNAGHQG